MEWLEGLTEVNEPDHFQEVNRVVLLKVDHRRYGGNNVENEVARKVVESYRFEVSMFFRCHDKVHANLD